MQVVKQIYKYFFKYFRIIEKQNKKTDIYFKFILSQA